MQITGRMSDLLVKDPQHHVALHTHDGNHDSSRGSNHDGCCPRVHRAQQAASGGYCGRSKVKADCGLKQTLEGQLNLTRVSAQNARACVHKSVHLTFVGDDASPRRENGGGSK